LGHESGQTCEYNEFTGNVPTSRLNGGHGDGVWLTFRLGKSQYM